MNDNRNRKDRLPIGKRVRTQVPKPAHYECPEGPAFIESAGKWIRIRVLLDSVSNIFLINQDLVKHFNIPYETCQKALNILAFDGEVNSSEGKHFTDPILLNIGNNGHRTSISCTVATAGKYDLIIPFGWWHKEPPIANIDNPQKWTFTKQHQENAGAWSKVVLNAPGPPRGVVVPVVHLVHSDPLWSTLLEILPKMWIWVDQGGPGGPGGP